MPVGGGGSPTETSQGEERYNYLYVKYNLTYLGLRNVIPYCWHARPTVGV